MRTRSMPDQAAAGSGVCERTKGPTRLRRMGSVMIRTPSISMTIVAWPRNVTRALPGGVTGGSIVQRGERRRRYHRAVVDLETIRSAPKVLLHDHLDGGLRPATVVELADAVGYADLPVRDADELGRWFRSGADRKSLELYLEGFRHTVAVMQTPDAIARVAAE